MLEGIVVIPLLGTYDEGRSAELLEKTLQNLPTLRAEFVMLDFTSIDGIFTEQTASLIERLGGSASLRVTETILVGMSPKVSMTIIKTGINLTKFYCFQTVEHGIHYALGQKGKASSDQGTL